MTVKAEPYDYELPAHKAALIMIDFQKDFMLPGGFGDALGNKIELLKVRLTLHHIGCVCCRDCIEVRSVCRMSPILSAVF